MISEWEVMRAESAVNLCRPWQSGDVTGELHVTSSSSERGGLFHVIYVPWTYCAGFSLLVYVVCVCVHVFFMFTACGNYALVPQLVSVLITQFAVHYNLIECLLKCKCAWYWLITIQPIKIWIYSSSCAIPLIQMIIHSFIDKQDESIQNGFRITDCYVINLSE